MPHVWASTPCTHHYTTSPARVSHKKSQRFAGPICVTMYSPHGANHSRDTVPYTGADSHTELVRVCAHVIIGDITQLHKECFGQRSLPANSISSIIRVLRVCENIELSFFMNENRGTFRTRFLLAPTARIPIHQPQSSFYAQMSESIPHLPTQTA